MSLGCFVGLWLCLCGGLACESGFRVLFGCRLVLFNSRDYLFALVWFWVWLVLFALVFLALLLLFTRLGLVYLWSNCLDWLHVWWCCLVYFCVDFAWVLVYVRLVHIVVVEFGCGVVFAGLCLL